MERQELINEKNELFMRFKTKFADRIKVYKSFFWIYGVFVLLFLFGIVRQLIEGDPINIKDTLYNCVFCCGIFAGIVINTIMCINGAKTENAEDFLANYDKYVKILYWTFAVVFTFLLITACFKNGFSLDFLVTDVAIIAVLFILGYILYSFSRWGKDIKRLRELVQETKQS